MKLSEFINNYSLHDGGLERIAFEPESKECTLHLELAASPESVSSEKDHSIDNNKGRLIIKGVIEFDWIYLPPLIPSPANDLDFEILKASVKVFEADTKYEILDLLIKEVSYLPLRVDNVCSLKIIARDAIWVVKSNELA